MFSSYSWSQDPPLSTKAPVEKYLALSPVMKFLTLGTAVIVFDSTLTITPIQDYKGSHSFSAEEPIARIDGKGKMAGLNIYYNYGTLPPYDTIGVSTGGKDGSAWGKVVCISATLTIYADNYVYAWKPVYYTDKFVVTNGSKLVRIDQPFFYIGRESIANGDLDMFLSQSEDVKIGSIAKGSKIQIVGYKWTLSDTWLLVTGATGIIGWHKLYTMRDDPRKVENSLLTVASIELFTGTYP